MDEYIEREALLHKIKWASSPEECVMSVHRMPAADVAPVRHGRWNLFGTHYCCSECLIALRDKVPYCPNCGAKMDLEG